MCTVSMAPQHRMFLINGPCICGLCAVAQPLIRQAVYHHLAALVGAGGEGIGGEEKGHQIRSVGEGRWRLMVALQFVITPLFLQSEPCSGYFF